jgi:hypothetical protein
MCPVEGYDESEDSLMRFASPSYGSEEVGMWFMSKSQVAVETGF